jgi:hypothetical protein
MPQIPWLRVLDTVIGVADIARVATGSRDKEKLPAERPGDFDVPARGGAGLEARLAGVVVAALKEAFDRDSRRLDLERDQLAAERARAERALQLELQRQAGDREIGRLRLLAGAAGAAWLGTLTMASRVLAGGAGARAVLGIGWLFLLGAVASAFMAQSRVAAAVDALANGEGRPNAIRSSASAAFALWLMICGLILAGLAVLIS